MAAFLSANVTRPMHGEERDIVGRGVCANQAVHDVAAHGLGVSVGDDTEQPFQSDVNRLVATLYQAISEEEQGCASRQLEIDGFAGDVCEGAKWRTGFHIDEGCIALGR